MILFCCLLFWFCYFCCFGFVVVVVVVVVVEIHVTVNRIKILTLAQYCSYGKFIFISPETMQIIRTNF